MDKGSIQRRWQEFLSLKPTNLELSELWLRSSSAYVSGSCYQLLEERGCIGADFSTGQMQDLLERL